MIAITDDVLRHVQVVEKKKEENNILLKTRRKTKYFPLLAC